MILSGNAIKEAIDKKITIEPFNEKQLNPNSYDLLLHNELLIYDEPILDMKKKHKTKKICIPTEGYVLEPNTLYLARAIEYIKTDYYIPMIEGKSSIARLGIFVHVTAGLGQIGSSGYWTLELTAVQPIRIYANIAICQIFFQTIQGTYSLYEGPYKGDLAIEPSKLYLEYNNNE